MSNSGLYWGEIHTHTDLSDGNGTLEQNFDIAASHLDFWAMADHAYDPEVFDLDYGKTEKDGKRLNDHWPRVQGMCKEREVPGTFIPILGYEWTNFQYGHHNVYYLDYDQPLRLPPTLPDLYAELRGIDAVVIPHHSGYAVGMCGKDWDCHDEVLTPFVELYSFHGSSEEPGGLEPLLTWGSWMGPGDAGGSVQEALARGYKLGIMASSDSHLEHPGAYDNGLIAVYADELTRGALWESFQRRRIYGVTGDRIELAFDINGRPMGSTIDFTPRRELCVAVKAWNAIERIDIIKNNNVLASYTEPAGSQPEKGTSFPLRFHLEWGWDRLRNDEWEAVLSVRHGRFVAALPCYRGSTSLRAGRGIQELKPDACRWTSRQEKLRVGAYCRRFADAVAFELEVGPETILDLDVTYGAHKQTLSIPTERLLAGSLVRYMEDVPPTNNGAWWSGMETYAKFKLHQAFPVPFLTVALEYEDKGAEGTGQADFYYVRVIQKNGQRAWSSPIWVDPVN